MKKLLLITFLLIATNSNATQITYGTTYAPNGQVTSVNLNGNFSNVSSVVNGKLDNTNADTTNGYRFYKTVAVLPSAGSQGAVYFLTSDNSLNFDTGGGFSKSVDIISPSINSFPVYDGAAWQPKDVKTAAFTAGMIMMWSGTIATIPSGWVLCDGSNSTPDLRDKFVVGARSDSGGVAKTDLSGSLTQSGGSTTIDITQMPAHTHTIATSNTSGGGTTNVRIGVAAQADTPQTTSSAGGGQPYEQPYFALAFIMKT